MSKNNAILLKLAVGFIIAMAYLFIVVFSSRCVHRESIFFSPKITYITAVINSSIIILGSVLMSSGIIKWLKNYNKKFFIIIFIIIFLTYPIFFLKSGIVADEKYISKTNVFGTPIEQYSYSEVESFETSIKYGVQYEITFNSNNTISLYSHEMIFLNYFKSEKNIKIFDELLEQHAERKVYESIYSTPENLKNFFRKEKYYNHFNRIFNRGGDN